MEMFGPAMKEMDAQKLATTLKEKGYAIFEGALTREYVDLINQESGDLYPDFNVNAVGPVLYKNQRYLTHCLARSEAIFNLMTRSWCFDVMKAYFGSGFRLTDQRVYVTTRGERMQWHVDNKLDDSSQTEFPGIIFIFYLCDVDDGELQLLDGSNGWSNSQKGADFTDAYVNKNYAKDVVSIRMPAGTLVVYDTTIVHRAHPIRRSGWSRKSLFFQVERKEAGGEPVLIDTRFAKDLTPEQEYFLGFGASPQYRSFPHSSIDTVRPGLLGSLMVKASKAIFGAALRSVLWKLSPDIRMWLKARV